METDLKNEFEQKKIELEEMQERLAAIKQQIAHDERVLAGEQVEGGLNLKDKEKFSDGLKQIKELVTDIYTGVDGADLSPTNKEKHILELKRIIPVELSKVTHKITSLENEIKQLEQCKVDIK